MAKFKVGDRVKLSDSHPRFPNRDAVVTRVFPTGFIKVKVDGAEDIEVAERLISPNAARNAKFKKGDLVITPFGKATAEVVKTDGPFVIVKMALGGREYPVKEDDLKPYPYGTANSRVVSRNAVRSLNIGKAIVSRVGNEWYYSRADGAKDGRGGPFRSKDEARVSAMQNGFVVVNAIRALCSANAVVQKAMNAVARNDLSLVAAKADRIAAQRIRQLEREFTELFKDRIAEYIRRVRLTDAKVQELKTADVRAKASYRPGLFPSVSIAAVSRSKFAEEIAMAGGYFGTRLERWLQSVWKEAGGGSSDWVSRSDWAGRN